MQEDWGFCFRDYDSTSRIAKTNEDPHVCYDQDELSPEGTVAVLLPHASIVGISSRVSAVM